ncbi:nitrite reductase small subunit NirD [Paenilisteria rocourtiae]|uniref:Assimilatory nitrite reductase (NAD(P)H) small subunit n=1 Tax=Listeria rocourtiae TaxID=647910 RepID=A0A4R6ZLN8_9LIST|nr:nitrite reductase small subunit NirD [Listeria rocourtiae]EUJ47127.1 nitrite reductase [NAD(P)H], small subunit [Listeria rocourtiae FSL F6-920]MBC1604383.1 nitrite reductase small subunit NirD [Listeria rocourtiae]TDR53245.1 assimilatory nitrite reductase (NAD(P)H) small subunit [Listeria rocourtiae]
MKKSYIADLESLTPLIGREIIMNGAKIALFRLSDDNVKAIENRCPHKNGPLAEGTVSGTDVFCPLHDYKISLETGLVAAPDDGCVKTYETLVENGKIYLVTNA